MHRSVALVRAGQATRHISLDLVDAAAPEVVSLGPAGGTSGSSGLPGAERLAVILSGRARVLLDGRDAGSAGGRGDVFEGAGDAVYLPSAAAGHLVAESDALTVVVASTAPRSSPEGPARIIRASDQQLRSVGRGSWQRTVRTILGPSDPASRLLVGETINPPGLWSSFPPHRHDRDSADEARLEEVYLFKVLPQDGFGVQLRYVDDTEQETRIVRDGEVAVIASGYHPVVAAPGHQLYYLWVMAGEGREQRAHFDPRYTWVEERG